MSINLVLEKIKKDLMKVSTTRSKHDNINEEKIKGRVFKGNLGFP